MKRLLIAVLVFLSMPALAQFTPQALTQASTGIEPKGGYFRLPDFTTATLPTPTVSGVPVYDTTAKAVKVSTGSAWVVLAYTSDLAAYLALTGGTLTGVLSAQDVLPSSTGLYSLGSGTRRWSGIYVSEIMCSTTPGATLYFGDSGEGQRLSFVPTTGVFQRDGHTVWDAGNSSFLSSETDPTVPAWAKASTKPSYSAAEVGAIPVGGETDPTVLTSIYVPGRFVLAIGDSKSLPGCSWGSMLQAAINDAGLGVWSLQGRGVGGATVATCLSSDIASAIATVPSKASVEYIFCNLGANDVGGLPAEVTWETNYYSIISALHSAFPSAKIYLSKPWRRGYATECNTLAGWIDAVIAMHPDFILAGDDERSWLEGGDNGATYTVDGVHYSDAGHLVKRTQMKALLVASGTAPVDAKPRSGPEGAYLQVGSTTAQYVTTPIYLSNGSASPGRIGFYEDADNGGFATTILGAADQTAFRNQYLQDDDGTIALTKNIPSVYSWALAATKPTYTYTEVGAQVAGSYAASSHAHSAADMTSGNLLANRLQSAPADLGAANVNVDWSNSNGAYETDFTTDGWIKTKGLFAGLASPTTHNNCLMALGNNTNTDIDLVINGALSSGYGFASMPNLELTKDASTVSAFLCNPHVSDDGSAHTVTDYSGLKIGTLSKTANVTATTAYGILITNPTIGATNYALYTTGTLKTTGTVAGGSIISYGELKTTATALTLDASTLPIRWWGASSYDLQLKRGALGTLQVLAAGTDPGGITIGGATGNVPAIQTGTAAANTITAGKAGDIYIKTDTPTVYIASAAGTANWVALN